MTGAAFSIIKIWKFVRGAEFDNVSYDHAGFA